QDRDLSRTSHDRAGTRPPPMSTPDQLQLFALPDLPMVRAGDDLADLIIAAEVGKDPRLVEVILSESTRVVRSRPNLIIVQHRLGFVMANAGVDQSNV